MICSVCGVHFSYRTPGHKKKPNVLCPKHAGYKKQTHLGRRVLLGVGAGGGKWGFEAGDYLAQPKPVAKKVSRQSRQKANLNTYLFGSGRPEKPTVYIRGRKLKSRDVRSIIPKALKKICGCGRQMRTRDNVNFYCVHCGHAERSLI